VQDLIESTQKKVCIHEDSDDYANLTPGSSKITGLTTGKYYRLEEYDEELVFKRNLFIQADGTNYGDLSKIAPLTGNQITNLKNDYTYKVKYAKPFDNGTHDYFSFNDTAKKQASITNGIVKIIGGTADNIYFLNLAPVISNDKNYEVMKNPISGDSNQAWGDSKTSARYISNSSTTPNPYNLDATQIESRYDKYLNAKSRGIFQYNKSVTTTNSSGIQLNGMSIIALADPPTISDYIFAEYDSNSKVTKFIVLNVERVLIYNVTFSTISADWTSAVIPVFNGGATISPVSQSSSTITVTITLTNDSDFDVSTIKWYDDGTQIGTGKTLTISETLASSSTLNWYQQGTHTITFEACEAGGSIPYSGKITVTCNP